MEIRKGLDDSTKAFIKSKRWYHQQMDACPHFSLPIAFAEVRREERKPKGTEAVCRCGFFSWGRFDWYLQEEDNGRATDVFLERSAQDPGFSASLMERWKGDEERFYKLCRQMDGTDLHALADEELLKSHEEFVERYIKRCTSSSIIDGFALGGDRIIAQRIHQHLQSIGKEDEYDAIFSILTAPVQLSFTNQAELSLLRVAALIKEVPDAERLFLCNDIDGIMMSISDFPDIDKALSAHQKGYFWTQNNFNDTYVLTEEHFASGIRTLFSEGIDIRHELQHIEEHPQNNKEAKEDLMEELELPPDLKALIRYSEDFTHWQDERKKSAMFASHHLSLFLKEIGRRCGVPLEEMKYLLPNEVQKVFDGSTSRAELRERMEGCLFLFDERHVSITTDRKTISELHRHFDSMDLPQGDIDVIKGLCASIGKAKGKVKVIRSAREIGKIMKGDILVAVMTRPDYIVGMKKAAAIVTNEGGITCHAAIVARELRIPCVIATRFATKVLKDGDIVEVYADKGEVRIQR